MATVWEYFLGSVAISFSLSPNIASKASPPYTASPPYPSPKGEGSDYRQGDEDGVGVGAARPYIPTAYATMY